MLDEICRKIQSGNRKEFQRFIKLPVIELNIHKYAIWLAHRLSTNFTRIRDEVIYQLWNAIQDYPKDTLKDNEVIYFLFSSRLKGKVIDEVYSGDMGMIRKRKGDKITYCSKVEIKDGVEMESISITPFEKEINREHVIWEAVKSLNEQEQLCFILYWDLDLEPLYRERGRWSLNEIALLLDKPVDYVESLLDKALEKVKKYVKATKSR